MYLYVSPCRFPINHVSIYICLYFAVLIYLFFTLLKMQRDSRVGGALHVAVQWEGTMVGQISCCPSLQAGLHIKYR
jgi:hypothetical protein